jgi:hypothetical protein
MWINQPSTAQPLHRMHAFNVLAIPFGERPVVTIYFLSGDAISMEVPKICLSSGWVNKRHDGER